MSHQIVSLLKKPWSGRLRTKSALPDVLEGYSNVDGGESSGSEFSLDEELGIPAMKTPGVKKALEAANSRLAGLVGSKIRFRDLVMMIVA